MKIDLKLIFLVLIVLCVVSECAGLWGGGSRRRSSSPSRRRSSPPTSGWGSRRRSGTSPSSRRTGWGLRRRASPRPAPSGGLWRRWKRRRATSRPKPKPSGGFWRRRRVNPRPPHSVKTKSGLTKIFNSKVKSVQRVERPMSGFLGKMGIKHSGVIVTTTTGKKYLIHKGKKYGVSGQTVVVDPKHMSSKWKTTGGAISVKKGTNIGDFVKAGGKNYNIFFNNCHHATKNMCKLG